MKKIFKSDFYKNVLTLFTGTTIAQLLPIVITPILTRIYSPQDFGVFALYTSVVAILSVLSTGRYELAIIIPKKEKDAINIAGLAFFINLSISLFILLIFIIGGQELRHIFGLDELGIWIYFIPFSLILLGLYQITYYWYNRRKLYKDMSINKVIQQTAVGVSNITIGHISRSMGLIFSTILGQIFSLSLIMNKFIRSEKSFIKRINKKDVFIQAKRYIDFPKYLTFAHTLNVSSNNLTTILFSKFFNSVAVGQFSLTQRILRLPLSFIGSSITDVFRQKAAEDIRTYGNCRKLYIKTLFTLFILSIFPFIILYIISPWLFAFVFGEEWRVAGDYARLIIPMLFLQFLTSPLSSLFMVLEKQKLDLVWQIILFILILASLLVGYLVFNSIEISLILFSSVYSLMYIINGIMTYKFSLNK